MPCSVWWLWTVETTYGNLRCILCLEIFFSKRCWIRWWFYFSNEIHPSLRIAHVGTGTGTLLVARWSPFLKLTAIPASSVLVYIVPVFFFKCIGSVTLRVYRIYSLHAFALVCYRYCHLYNSHRYMRIQMRDVF
jgi:hypothetical protein